MELAISEFKNNPERFWNDFEEIKKNTRRRGRGRKSRRLAERTSVSFVHFLQCYYYYYYRFAMDVNVNWPRYTTALRDTGKGSLQGTRRNRKKVAPGAEANSPP